MCKGTTNFSNMQEEPTLFPLSKVQNKSVTLDFESPDVSSLGGLTLLREDKSSMSFIRNLASCIPEWRKPELIKHSLEEMCQQRIFQIAAGFEDCDDCDILREDSVLKMMTNRLPGDDNLASQPTMSRLENHVNHKALYDIAECFVEHFIKSYEKTPSHIIIDADDSNSNAYGQQLQIVFNQYYGEFCFMPLFLFEGHSRKLILPVLRPGRVNKRINVFGLLKRVLTRLRSVWPKTFIEFRGDGQFCGHEIMEWIEMQHNMGYIIGFSQNQKLNKRIEPLVEKAKQEFENTGNPVKTYHTLYYKAGTWKYIHKLVVKIEVNTMGTNIRFIATNLRISKDSILNSQYLYEHYCGRGNCELDIKEVKTYLHADRMSCHNFCANQFRLFMYCAAYVVLNNLKSKYFRMTQFESATIATFRAKVLLSACYIKELKGSIKIQLSKNNPAIVEISDALRKLRAA